MEAESIFDRDALLKGRIAAVSDIKRHLRRPESLTMLCTCLLTMPRHELEAKVVREAMAEAEVVGVSMHKLRSFVTGYTDVMTAFARMRENL